MRGFTLTHLRQLVQHTAREFMHDGCTQMAAAISYYVLFSLFPLLIFAVGVLGFALQDSQLQQNLIDAIQENIPLDESGDSDVANRVGDIAGAGSGALGLLGLIGMAWAGSNMFAIIRRSLNTAWDIEVARPFARQKLVDFTMMVILGVLFMASLAATGVLRAAERLSSDIPIAGPLSEDLGLAWVFAAFLIPVLVSFAGFFILYWFLPATHVRPREALVGAAVASFLFELGKLGFATYIENFGNYNAVYGSLGTVVIFLFWVYISANVLLIGAELAAEIPCVMRGDYDHPPTLTPASITPFPVRIRHALFGFFRALVIHEPRTPGKH
jgi:membrane protein